MSLLSAPLTAEAHPGNGQATNPAAMGCGTGPAPALGSALVSRSIAPGGHSTAPQWTRGVDPGGQPLVQLVAPGYTLRLPAGTNQLEVFASDGGYYRTLPMAVLAGRAALPRGTRVTASASGSQLTLVLRTSSGLPFEVASVSAWSRFFTISFTAKLGAASALPVRFFAPQRRGAPTGRSSAAFVPSGLPSGPTPAVRLGARRPSVTAPFAPPPFYVELPGCRGGLGLGLVQIPDATTMTLLPDQSLAINYPLALLATFADGGAGGRVAAPTLGSQSAAAGRTWLRFPDFVVTTASGPMLGLRAYRVALGQLGAAPVAGPPGTRPSWWSWPMADTWGQQMMTGAAWSAPKFTSAWVQRFVSSWRRQFRVRHFTVVIDSRWQSLFGGPTPSQRFGGVAGMRRLIRSLHAQGLRVLLWWPLWISGKPGSRALHLIDPTAPGFRSTITRAMSIVTGRGAGQLGADGLKLDWGYHVPQNPRDAFARPALGVGAAALLRYMSLLSGAAWDANPKAMIDASAVAPQFGGTEDAIRLYDASSNAVWNRRAAIVAEVDPGIIIDGDGWRLTSAQAAAHIVDSAVYGIPAVYFVSHWAGGQAISRPAALALGAVMLLAGSRGQGQAHPSPGGNWSYVVAGRVVARTLGGGQAVEIIRYRSCGLPWVAIVVAAVAGQVRVSVPSSLRDLSVRGPHGRSPSAATLEHVVRLVAAAGVPYTVTASHACAADGSHA